MKPICRLLEQAEYMDSVHQLAQLPVDDGFEVAIAGRSNAGKSSLINRLCRRNALAKTSRTPGRTRQLVFFRLDQQRRLVDLPGYGFARVSGELKQHWQGLIRRYLESRRVLVGLVVVMDARHPLKPLDCELIEWSGQRGLGLHLVLTKADKLGRGRQARTLADVRRVVHDQVGVQLFSAESGQGVDELQRMLASWFAVESADAPARTPTDRHAHDQDDA